MSFVRWNQTTQIWERAVTPENPTTAWNHLPIADPTQALDTANKQYVDTKVASVTGFVPYVGAVANVDLGNFQISAKSALIKTQALANGPTLGYFTGTGLANLEPGGGYGLNFGVSSSGDSWIQAQRFNGTGSVFNINLNPSGGRVAVGNTNPQLTFHVGLANTAPFQGGDGIFVNFAAVTQIAVRNSANAIEGGLYAYTAEFYIGTWTNHQITFRTNNTNRAYISAGGNFGFLGGVILASGITPPALSANVDNYNPAGLATARFIFQAASATMSIFGLAGGEDGRVISIVNNSGVPITLVNLASSVTADRFINPLGNIVLNTWHVATFRHIGGFGWLCIGVNT